jgi:hypothetical protein
VDGDGSTTTASQGDPAPEGTPAGTGAPANGGGAADQSEALRNLQSQRDRQAAEIEQLRKQLADAQTPKNSDPTPAPTTPAPSLSAQDVVALLKRDRELTAAASQLKTDFPFADEALFTGYDSFDSVEAFRAAVEASHTRTQTLAEKAAQPLIDAALAPYVEKYGRLAAPPATGSTEAPAGMPSPEQIKQFSVAQVQAFIAKHGEEAYLQAIYGTTTNP